MFQGLNTDTLADLARPHRSEPFVELWELVVDRTETWRPTLCIVGQHEPVEFGGVTFHPFPVERTAIEWDNEGGIPKCTLAISNVSRLVARWVETGAGFVEQPATLWAGLRGQIDQPGGVVSVGWSITAAAINDQQLQLELSAQGIVSLDLPAERLQRERCGWRFRSDECAYEPDPALGANYTSCRKDIVDCTLRGDDEEARGLPRMHPQQFGGFPGLPRLSG